MLEGFLNVKFSALIDIVKRLCMRPVKGLKTENLALKQIVVSSFTRKFWAKQLTWCAIIFFLSFHPSILKSPGTYAGTWRFIVLRLKAIN
jgi:hypothetical protein